ncbi:unnamed protein product, partial [Toxocara canis]|uniref:Apple domain-containing protein n=1 Tax=Toxocara canis TaxID=6265 RepID=A0A183VFR8_TOXCA
LLFFYKFFSQPTIVSYFHGFAFTLCPFSANAKKICTKKFHKISNSVFFQRTETSSAEKCIERCIEELEHCKAAVFTHNKTKSNGLCQLYAVNSQSEDVRIEVDGTLNPVSTVFEVLDKCAVSLSSNKDDIANRLEPELKQKLEEWTDQPEEKHEKATESESDDTQKSTESSGESHRKETSESIRYFLYCFYISLCIHTEHPKTKIAVSEFNEPRIIPEDNQERSSDRSRFRTLVSSRGQWVSGVYDGRNFGLQPVPIRPTQVLRGGAPISCAGANCYAPAVVVSPQLVYSPCPALAGDPCAPHPPPPCQTVLFMH